MSPRSVKSIKNEKDKLQVKHPMTEHQLSLVSYTPIQLLPQHLATINLTEELIKLKKEKAKQQNKEYEDLLAKSNALELQIQALQTEKDHNTVAMKSVQSKYDDIECKFAEVLTAFESYIKDVE